MSNIKTESHKTPKQSLDLPHIRNYNIPEIILIGTKLVI